ncbi:PhzF family phenazine biosynthesis protein [Nonomuraea basaltis]|uniref:PhzF family phenazine biosynthesis protein n=1 Tax=Nonomuraea basaltis TaxID=2495887 RepID=UPI00110C637C|nr:PhzF family phenazine biosynthesis isomerase [Nonomuraea basaltis]TMR98706.1 PhzF family phenazine biosynthesis protein [Nonomuraea basaltis]
MTEILRYAAFTTTPSGGNPAGVVLDAQGLSDAEMLAIAAELGYSETAFLLPTGERQYRIRYFSPLAEVAFCGHATIATSVALGERAGPGTVHLATQAGPVPVEIVAGPAGGITATLTSPPTSTRPASEEEVRLALAALGWSADDLDPAYPAHVANAGNDHLVLAAATRDRLADLDYDYDALGKIMAELGWTTVHLFWAESPTVFHARNPFPPGGVVEDPATGAAAAAFTGYLRALGHLEDGAVITIHQGVDMGRPSLLTCTVIPGDTRAKVSGTAVPIQ